MQAYDSSCSSLSRERLYPALPRPRMEPALPMLSIDPELPMLRMLPTLPMLNTEPALATLSMLPTLRKLSMLWGLLARSRPTTALRAPRRRAAFRSTSLPNIPLERRPEPVYHRASGPLRADGLLYRGHDLTCKGLHLTLVVPGGPVDERIHSVLQGELRERLHPSRYRAFEETLAFGADVAREVIGATDLSRLSSCSVGAFVDPPVHLGKAPWRRVGERGHPAVRYPTDEAEHLRPV